LVLGFDRSEHGKAAGMRTTLLVCLAASIAMIQVNLLLPTAGRTSDSFVMNDLMRLPLGILTGVGFIGGGAILRRDTLIVGLTTAATLWLATVIGLCIGGGQIALGVVGTLIGFFALWALEWFENALRREARGSLSLKTTNDSHSEASLTARLESASMKITRSSVCTDREGHSRTLTFEVLQMRRILDVQTPGIINELMNEPGVLTADWHSTV
jgi:putative Mg2+ transporter-C (MgtC) family protein